MKTAKKILALIFIIVLSISMIPTTNISAAKKTKLNKTKATIYVGKTVRLKLKNTKKKVKWSSSNKKIATVSKKGKVKGKKAGKVTITAKAGKKKYKCKVTVKKKTTPKPTTKPTEQLTTKPMEETTTKSSEQPTTPEATTPSTKIEEPSLNPQISQNVETIKKVIEIQQEQGTVDEEILNEINATNESEANKISEDFNIEDAVQAITNDTTQYNKYIDYHGGFYDEEYYNGDYDYLFQLTDSIVKYMWDEAIPDSSLLSLIIDDLANTYKYTMFKGDIAFNTEYMDYQYKQILSNYMRIGHPKFDSIDNFILESEPQKYYDKNTDSFVSEGIKYDDQNCSYIITFSSNERIYNAYMSFAKLDNDDGNAYFEYRLLDLTVEPITKDYMSTLNVNWDLEPDKTLTITEPYAGNIQHNSTVQITDYKIEPADKEGYNRLSCTCTVKKDWQPTVDEINTITNSLYCQQTGNIGGGVYYTIVDFNTGTCLEADNAYNITDSSTWEYYDYEKFKDDDTGAWLDFDRTSIAKISIIYPQDYTGLCIVIGGINQVIDTNSDNEFFNGNRQFGDTSYYKNGENNSHWMRVTPK